MILNINNSKIIDTGATVIFLYCLKGILPKLRDRLLIGCPALGGISP
jgi:hypothetical protein